MRVGRGRDRRTERLAVSGGPKSVAYPGRQVAALTRWPRYGAEEKKALHDMIDSGRFYQELPLFEKEWQDYTKSPYVKAHMNCSSALTSMYFALDLEPGSEIMVPSYTFFSTCLAMRFFGYVPIFVDIDPKTACFDLDDAKRKLTPRTKAVVAMHSWGLPCEMDHIAGWCREKGLILLEDAAHAHGGRDAGQEDGHLGRDGGVQLPGVEGAAEHRGRYGDVPDPGVLRAGDRLRQLRRPGDFPRGQPRAGVRGHRLRPEVPDAPVRRRGAPAAAPRPRRPQRCWPIKNVRALNDRLVQLPGLSEPRCRPDQKRVYYYANMLLLDERKAGFSRDALLKALVAEGVQATIWDYPEQHKMKIYSEAKWWHHAPTIPTSMPGNEQVNHTHIFLPLLYGEASELIDQYVRALRRSGPHRSELAML